MGSRRCRLRPNKRDYTVVIDSREQLPYSWAGVTCVRSGLPTGDYSLVEAPNIVVERKSLADLYGCLTRGRRRFEDCLKRLSEYQYPCVVIETTMADLLIPFTYVSAGGITQQSRVPPSVAYNSILSWQSRYRIPFLLCGSREVAQRMTLEHLDVLWRHLKREQAKVAKQEAEIR